MLHILLFFFPTISSIVRLILLFLFSVVSSIIRLW
jgi:hypothetical protein